MINKRCRTGSPLLKLAFFTILFLFSLAPSLWAQNRRYVTEQRFIQRLVWIGDEYAFRYEVVIERNEGEGYREYKRESTASSELVVSLPLGNYRYHVTPYDYLDQPGETSDWVTLDVLAPPVIPVETPEPPASGSGKPIDIMLSAAWTPLIPLYGGMQEIFGHEFYPAGAMLRFDFLYTQLNSFNPGLELSISWYMLDKAEGNEAIKIQTGATDINIVAQKWLPNRQMAVTIRAGGGFAFQIGEINIEQYLYSMGSLIPHINLEASFLWLALKQFYLEAGLNYTYFLAKDNSSAYMRPWVGIGVRF